MWEIHNYDQLLTFGYSIILGAIFCSVYDVLRAHRRVNEYGYISVFVADIMFWIVAAFATFLFLLARTNGEIRGYVLVAELLGFALFRVTISKLIFAVLVIAFKFLNGIFMRLQRFSNCIFEKVCLFLKKLLKILKRVDKRAKKLLKNISKIVYTKRNYVESENRQDGC